MKKSWKALKQSRISPEGEQRIRARVARELEELSLRDLRREFELTQVEVGRSLEMSQSELSRLESRSDHLTSTLRRYIEALGGELEVTAVFGERRVKLTDA